MGRRNEAGCEGYQGQIKGIPQDVIHRGGFRLPFFVGIKNLKKVSVTLDFTLKISDTVFNERGKHPKGENSMERIDIRYTAANGRSIRIFSINDYGEVLVEIDDQPWKAFSTRRRAENWLKRNGFAAYA